MFNFLRDWLFGSSENGLDANASADASDPLEVNHGLSRDTDPTYSFEPTNIYHDSDPAFSAESTNLFHDTDPTFAFEGTNVFHGTAADPTSMDSFGTGSAFDSGMNSFGTDSFGSSGSFSDSFGESSFGSDFGGSSFGSDF